MGVSGRSARKRIGKIGIRAPGNVVSRHGRPQPRMYISRLPVCKEYILNLGVGDEEDIFQCIPVLAAAGIRMTRVPRSFGVEISLKN